MNPFKSNRLAWSVAVASIALWATSAPITLGQVASGTVRLLDQATTDDTSISISDETATMASDSSTQSVCPTPVALPPAVAQLLPPTPVTGSVPVPAGQDGTFHICGADTQAEGAIAQLVAGRGFSATLTARGDGCADLTVHPNGQVGNGSSTSNLSVGVGSGRTLSIQIASEAGETHASITSR